MGLILAGERSGVGKTTITLALLAALTSWGERVQSFKVGPDYLDPQLHRWVTGRGCPNLDTMLTSSQYVQNCYHYHTGNVEYALVEGVMGLFDGPSSTAQVAKLLGLAVVLVVDCGRLAGSVAALVQGYARFDPQVPVVGVILNRVASDRHSELLRAALAPLGMTIVGECRRQTELHYPERHLGLIPPTERENLAPWRRALKTLGQTCFAWDVLRPLLQVHSGGNPVPPWLPLKITHPLRIAVAWDEAFNFYYDDQLALLRCAGVELYFWSPLRSAPLPTEIQGLILGGGYPELWAEPLSQRQDVLQNLRQRIRQGLAVYAECGGLMFLGETLITSDGTAWPLVGAIPLVTRMMPRLTLGYREIIATLDTCFVAQGQGVTGHEFHYSQGVNPNFPAIYGSATLHASYIHCHWGGCPQQVQRFLDCVQQGAAQVV
ncbi:cobyrinic acid a,c-diamide synthase [Gloeomargarita lithophora Alchichica-D10]|uniref:Cobyrinic acid a,c-diamide synthase n=1 Tax=Gloeomargarita lithophora Alchichica-D10 TaxID=1188229 RepID=A0A1J0AEU0_9CYAN|nr:cobyrinate a,c-diamide synthase [Gloeomargarita lithophora]APB34432.1 cobyrinic acid a,c-diamide synthase [Gloeomargarita lithophora Alchichica-D10]